MTLKGILLGALIGSVVAALIGIGVMKHQDATWLVREQELNQEIDRWRHLSDTAGDRANEAVVRANTATRDANKAIWERDKARKQRRTTATPTTLANCLEQNEEFRASEVIADRVIASLQLASLEKDSVIFEKDQQILAMSNVADAERERGDGWKRYSKRGKVKTAFFGIGMALGGGLLVYGATTAANR